MTLGFLIRGLARCRPVAARRTLGGAGLGLILGLGLVSGGCDSGSFVPTRPPELDAGTPTPTPAAPDRTPGPAVQGSTAKPVPGARAVELVLGPHDVEGAEELKVKARSQAGNEGVRIQIEVTGEKGNPDSEAELVRQVNARDALVLIVEPARSSDADLSRAISEARDGGRPVILVG